MMKFRENILFLMVVVAVVSGSYPGGGWNDNPHQCGFPGSSPQQNNDSQNFNEEHQFFNPTPGDFRNNEYQAHEVPSSQKPAQYINFIDDTPTQLNLRGNENYHLDSFNYGDPLPHHQTGYSAQPFGGDNTEVPAHQDFQPWYGQGYPQQQETNYPYHTISTELNLGGPSNYQTDAYEPSLTLQPSGVQVHSQSFGEYDTAAHNPTGQFGYSTQIPFDPYSQYGNYGASTSNADFGRTNNEYPETSGRIMLRGSGSSNFHANEHEEFEQNTNLASVPEYNEGYDPAYEEYNTTIDKDDLEPEIDEDIKKTRNDNPAYSLLGAECQIKIQDLHQDHGIITNSDFNDFLYPSEDGVLTIKGGKEMKLSCVSDPSGQTTSLLQNAHNRSKRKTSSVRLGCFFGQLLEVAHPFPISHYKCTEEPRPFIKRSDEPCPMSPDNIHRAKYQIGVPMAQDNFNVFVDVCVDNDTDDNSREIAYVKTELNRSLNGREVHKSKRKQKFIISQNSFLKDWELPSMYIKGEQRISLRVQLSQVQRESIRQYNELHQSNHNRYYLVPGKLIGRNDFIYRIAQRSAYLYATTRPMWVHLEKNWDKVEEAILQLVTSRDAPITVYSGTHGVLTHADNTDIIRELYLGNLSGTQIPYHTIPQLFFKVLVSINPDLSGSCAVVVGHNTTYEVAVGDACTAVDLRWLDEHIVNNEAYGVVYGCECKTFRREVLMKLPLWNLNDYSLLKD